MNETVHKHFPPPFVHEAKGKRYSAWQGMNPAQLSRRAEAAPRLQGRNCLRGCRLALDPGRHPSFSILRDSQLGR